jgi:beta-glucanase (GH16 family)
LTVKLSLLLASLLGACGPAQSANERARPAAAPAASAAPVAAAPRPEFEPAWADEFDRDGRPDPANWTYLVGDGTKYGLPPGWGNNELEWYTEDRPENARVENGHLIIETRRDHFEGHEYSSARLVGAGRRDFTYGRVEVRARVPKAAGVWPAIWMLPTQWTYGDKGWPANGEIDIVEFVTVEPDIVHVSIHTTNHNHAQRTQLTAKRKDPTFSTDFHVFVLEWLPDSLTWLIDGQKVLRFDNPHTDYKDWPFDKDFHVLLNVAVGGWGGKPDPALFPQRMEVDYVRVMRLKR